MKHAKLAFLALFAVLVLSACMEYRSAMRLQTLVDKIEVVQRLVLRVEALESAVIDTQDQVNFLSRAMLEQRQEAQKDR